MTVVVENFVDFLSTEASSRIIELPSIVAWKQKFLNTFIECIGEKHCLLSHALPSVIALLEFHLCFLQRLKKLLSGVYWVQIIPINYEKFFGKLVSAIYINDWTLQSFSQDRLSRRLRITKYNRATTPTYMPTYVGNWSLQTFSQDYEVTSLMLCALILYMSGGTCSLKLTQNDRFLRNFSGQF